MMKEEKRIFQDEIIKNGINGITLIALIVMIIILLILGAITYSKLTDNGIVEKSREAKQRQIEANAKEEIDLIINEVQIEKNGMATLNDIVKILKENEENIYKVTTTSSVATLDISGISYVPNAIENIYVTNLKYGVEIKISNANAENESKKFNVDIIGKNNYSSLGTINDVKVSMEKYITENTIMGVKINIEKLPSNDYIDLNKSRFVVTTSNEELGINDNLYTGGTLEEGTTDKSNWTITNGIKAGTYYAHILLVCRDGNKKEIISSEPVKVDGIKNFEYTGNSQSITLPKGKYKMECWGAQGGGNIGGHGAYTVGTLEIDEEKTFYIYVGGTTNNQNGGYNGGGNGIKYGGGGSTDIRLINEDLKSRIMVAAGGSGGNVLNGAAGGTLTGLLINGATGNVATQTKSGTNGKFGYASNSNQYTGAGGGYYSGGESTKVEEMNVYIGNENETISLDGTYKIKYGANGCWNYNVFTGKVTLSNEIFGDPIVGTVKTGYKVARYYYISSSGSSYISGHVGCIAIKENLEAKVSSYSDITDSYHYSNIYFTNTEMKAGNDESLSSKTGNGSVRITCVD